MPYAAEGCRELTSLVPLRSGERHCYYCSGYGAHPIPFDVRSTQVNPERCYCCNGTGKQKISRFD